MSEQKGELLAAVYPNEEHAKTTLDMLVAMHKAVTITLIDAAMVTKDETGKIHVKETAELTTRKGAKRGAIVAGVFGLIFPPSLIASVLVGGGVGALAGKLRDTGIKSDQVKDIADRIEPGKAAVIALTEGEFGPQVQQALTGYEGTLLIQAVSEDTLKEIYIHEGEG